MKLMWNPYRSTSELISQFAYGYYGAVAAPYVLRHIEIFADGVNSSFLSEGVSYTSSYLSPAACIGALSNIKQAEKAVVAEGLANVSTALERLRAIEYGTLYVVLLRWDEMKGCASLALAPLPLIFDTQLKSPCVEQLGRSKQPELA